MKKILLLVAIAVLSAVVAFAAPSGAPTVLDSGGGVNTTLYHSYDGLVCTDCHTLHNSEGGTAVGTNLANSKDTNSGPYRELLKRGNWTDMCLSCHKQGNNTAATAMLEGVSTGVDAVTGVDYGNWTAPIVMTTDGVDPAGIAMPGGDFYYSNLDPGRGHNPTYSPGDAAGTSVFIASDATLLNNPPGGALVADVNNNGTAETEWSCHSCHGMHARHSGSYTAYRQIKRKVNNIMVTGRTTVDAANVETYTGAAENTAAGYEAILSNSRGDIQGTNYVNTRKDGSALDGANLWADEGAANKNIYRGGFSSLCATCHGDFHGGNGEAEGTANGKTFVGTAWVKHPTNIVMDIATSAKRKYGWSATASTTTYNVVVSNAQGNNPNPVGYDWKYPLIVPESAAGVLATTVATNDDDGDEATSLNGQERMMCLTCHKAHATQYSNMTRWDASNHAFIANGATDFTGAASTGDNPAYGCGKCHQKGGTKAFVKQF